MSDKADVNFFEELLRIADTLTNQKDAIILRAAAFASRSPEPKLEELKLIPGFGYSLTALY